jgi:hypothetical protein
MSDSIPAVEAILSERTPIYYNMKYIWAITVTAAIGGLVVRL